MRPTVLYGSTRTRSAGLGAAAGGSPPCDQPEVDDSQTAAESSAFSVPINASQAPVPKTRRDPAACLLSRTTRPPSAVRAVSTQSPS